MIGNSTASAFNTAVGGMLNSNATMNADALSVVRAGTTAGSGDYINDVSLAMVDMKIQQNTFAASAKVIKSADDMLGSLLDIMG